MDSGQLIIKIILIVVLTAFGVFLMLPGRGQRHIAVRRLLMILLLVLTLLAIVFPTAVTQLARLVGVGRGADLLLYGLIVVYIGNSILLARRHRKTEREITELARQLALLQAPDPNGLRSESDQGSGRPVS